MRQVAEHGSLTAAAEALGYSQPAVSQQLRRFEERTGIALVERVGRGIRLTQSGRVLARHANAVATAIEAAAGELAEIRGLRAGRVRLIAFPSASATLVPRLIAALGAAHPGVAVTYVEAEPPEAVAAVRADRADLAITFSYPGDRDDPHRASARGLDVRAFGEEPIRLVLPAGHPAAVSDVVDLAALGDDPWIAGCPRCRGHLLELAATAGFTPRIAFETDNFVAVEGMVAQGLGVATAARTRAGGLAAASGRRDPPHRTARRALAAPRDRTGRGARARGRRDHRRPRVARRRLRSVRPERRGGRAPVDSMDPYVRDSPPHHYRHRHRRPRALLPVAHRHPARRPGAHRALQLGVRPAHRRHLRLPHRGHGCRARQRGELRAAARRARWLGLDWDEGVDVGGPHAPYRQSQRGEIYATCSRS